MITVEQFITQARTWLGVPWHHQGRSRLGVDCAGLPECVLAELGALPKGYRASRNYGRLPTSELDETLHQWCRLVWRRTSPDESPQVMPGYLIRIRYPKQERPSHLAICTGPTIIHAYRAERRRGPRGCGVMEHAYRTRWLDLTVDAWQAPGVLYE